ncbi:MAG: type II secretion system protein N [Janthinobacterium lividum]
MATTHSAFRPPRPASHGWRWAVGGALLGGSLALSIFAPARWLAAGLASATGNRLQLVNARGTVWNGTSGVVFSSGASGTESISLPGTLTWTLRPGWGSVSASLDLPCCAAQPLVVKARPLVDGVQLDWGTGSSRWPAAMLAGFGAPWNTLKPEGVLELSTQGFTMQLQRTQLALTGRAMLDATDISSSLSTLRPMGSYRITAEGGPTPTLLLTTREGSLQLNGSGRWNGRAMRFDGEASAAPGREEALSNLLNIIGRRDGARSLITLN